MSETTKAVKFYTVPAGSQSTLCRGETCGKRIWFIRTPNGKALPVDCDCEGGKRPSDTNDPGQIDLLTGGGASVYDGLGCSHFLTCSDADTFSRGAR